MTHNNSENWFLQPAKKIDSNAMRDAEAHQARLTKPPGSLGELESIAIKLAGYQGSPHPTIKDIAIRVFAADHGVCQQGVSAFPQIVTTQMIENFVQGGAAISVLAKQTQADFAVVNTGTANPLISEAGVINCPIANGTRDCSQGPAMSMEECLSALNIGREQVPAADLFIGGEMGIGNTTSASCIYSALLSLPAETTVGPGTGLDQQGQKHKRSIVDKALTSNTVSADAPLNILRCVGGFEIAALTGAYIRAAQQGIPSLVDGFITTAAALLATRLNPSVEQWLLFSHRSAEPAHIHALEAMNAKPLLDLGLRLGEGSGAAIAIPLLRTAVLLHNTMATFDAAGVAEG